MKVITGTAKVKDDSTYVYKGHTFEVLGVYMEYKNGNGSGVYADGTCEYFINLVGTPFNPQYGTRTVIHSKHLENLDLHQTAKLPLDEDEILELIEFAKNTNVEGEKNILEAYLESQIGPHTPPIPDLSTLRTDEEWEAIRNARKAKKENHE